MLHPHSRLKIPKCDNDTPTPKSHTINTLIISSDLITSTAPASKVHQHQTSTVTLNWTIPSRDTTNSATPHERQLLAYLGTEWKRIKEDRQHQQSFDTTKMAIQLVLTMGTIQILANGIVRWDETVKTRLEKMTQLQTVVHQRPWRLDAIRPKPWMIPPHLSTHPPRNPRETVFRRRGFGPTVCRWNTLWCVRRVQRS